MRSGFKFFLLLLLTAAAAVALILSPFCDVKNIKVKGNLRVETEKIIESSGILTGDNLYRTDITRVSRAIYNLPWVEVVTVKRKFPNEIEVFITEGTVCAYIKHGEQFISIDKNGKTIEKAEKAEDKPILMGLDGTDVTIGTRIKPTKPDAFKTALKYIQYIKDYAIPNVTAIDVTNPLDVTIYIGNAGQAVNIGTDENMSYKMAYLKTVLEKIPENSRGTLDLRDIEEGAVYRPPTLVEGQ